MKKFYFLLIVLILLFACKNEIKIVSPLLYPDIINYKALPVNSSDLGKNAFMDQGSWFGLSFYPDKRVGIAGLFSTNTGKWLSNNLCQVIVLDQELSLIESRFYPGFSLQRLRNDSLRLITRIFFYSPDLAVVDMRLTNLLHYSQPVKIMLTGSLFPEFKWSVRDSVIYTHIRRLGETFTIALASNIKPDSFMVKTTDYRIVSRRYKLRARETQTIRVLVYFGQREINYHKIKAFAAAGHELFAPIYNRWNRYLRSEAMNVKYHTLAVKSILTLVNNWKKSLGPFPQDVVIPSYSAGYFTGIWAWDTWKQAAGTALFDSILAGNQVLAMLKYQDSTGMIYDCVCLDESHGYDSVIVNSLDTKPPLAAWAVWQIFQSNHDTAFVRKVYPALKKFHYWWYKYRDFNHNGLCEYGARQNKVYAARWESGMDDAVRFDTARLAQNSAGQYSLLQESPDLNAFLYADKVFLSQIARVIGLRKEASRFELEANRLAQKINADLWDRKDGWYYDRDLISGRFIRVRESAGWIPLWAGVPDSSQAAAIARRMADTHEFNTRVPLPTLSAADPHFMTGYWRGPVWLDQVYFGISGLRRYGHDSLANALIDKLVKNAQGMLGSGELYENYSPIDGRPLNARNFSWSAASLLLMLTNSDK